MQPVLLVDDRAGSKKLGKIPGAILTRLEYGDACLVGRGEDDNPIFVGIEIKTIGDVLNCISDGRFAGHQLPGMQHTYDVLYLVVEGPYRADKSGALAVPRRGGLKVITKGSRQFMWSDLENWFNTMTIKAGLHVRRSMSERETLLMVRALLKWWTQKEWSRHRAHLQPDLSKPTTLIKPSLLRRVARELPGVGWEKAQIVEKHFNSVLAMCLATEEDWKEIPGIGKILSTKIVSEIGKHGSR